ncbi:MAG: beta-galactosidase [Chthonomonadetes bacterium]|nr:beta-galactosidase [Chthonomonadetes bacterium]
MRQPEQPSPKRPVSRLPIVGAAYFYWYEWQTAGGEWGNWIGGVHNTPLYGYYNSRTLADNFRSILLAADWGMTHLFMDYWGQGWQGENGEPREATVVKAAERVRALGYNLFMGLYQDGENFAMREFWRNVTERKDPPYWMERYARSPVWTWLGEKPYQLVYSRNGAPEVTIDHDGFRRWLRERYTHVDRLNAQWGTSFRDFDEINMDFNAVGPVRALSIAYQYERWAQEWAKMEQAIRERFGLPGLSASFDIGYEPYMGFGFERWARVFGGAHSYAGVFGVPHELDAQRYLHTAVTRACGGVFLDHLKHRYFDWNIRVPGTGYPPEPLHYDRFWAGNLLRRADGVLHLSWNEWWEGSNLEPSFEGGKRFCEANLLWSTIWQLTYPQNPETSTALLVNDWIFEHGAGDPNDLYHAVQGMRAAGIVFDVIPQSEATLERLQRYYIITAPTGGVGLGYNAKGERIAHLLEEWLKLGDRRLAVTVSPETLTSGDTPSAGKAQNIEPASRFNYLADIGAPGDEKVLLSGFSGREDWGQLPPGAHGAGSKATVRWLTGIGTMSTFILPAAPNTDLVLRWHGNSLWQQRLRVVVNEQEVGEVEIKSGWHQYEVPVPASVVGGSRLLEVQFRFEKAHVPQQIDPQRFPSENRVCNLALDWLQICTPNVPPGQPGELDWEPMGLCESTGLGRAKQTFRVPLHRRRTTLRRGTVQSYYEDGWVRDVRCVVRSERGQNGILIIVNGIFTDDPRWWEWLYNLQYDNQNSPVASLYDPAETLTWVLPDQPDLMSAHLLAGDTTFLLVENRTGTPRQLKLHPPVVHDPGIYPFAEFMAITCDGRRFVPLQIDQMVKWVKEPQTVRYVAVYGVVRSPVQIQTEGWQVFPGFKGSVQAKVRNIHIDPVEVTLKVGAKIASVHGEAVTLRLTPGQEKTVQLPLEVKPFADWGMKTVYVEVRSRSQGKERIAYFLRPLMVGRNAQVHVQTAAISSHSPSLVVANLPITPHGEQSWWHPALDVPGETARDVELVLTGWDANPRRQIQMRVGDIPDGARREIRLPLPFTSGPVTRRATLTVRWRDSAGTHQHSREITVTLMPRSLRRTQAHEIAHVILPSLENARGVPHSVTLPPALRNRQYLLRLPTGMILPAYVQGARLHFIVPPGRELWRLDIGSPGDEQVLVRGYAQAESWANATIRWLPGEGKETVLRLPGGMSDGARLLMYGQAMWENRVTVIIDGRPVARKDLVPGWQTLSVDMPRRARPSSAPREVRLVFERANVPAERGTGTDRRVCNFALDWIALEPVPATEAGILSLLPATAPASTSLSVKVAPGSVLVDNGVLELQWRQDAGGTITRLYSQRTGREVSASTGGVGIGVFGQFDPTRPAINTAQFVQDRFRWQRQTRAQVRVVERNPVWVTVEVTPDPAALSVRAIQRYRVFAGLPLVEVTVQAEPLSTGANELVALEARFSARWWSKTFPNFVGLGDKPQEVAGEVVHYGWRMGDWVPPVLSLFNPSNLSETLSLLVMQNEGCNWVRQGFWGEPRGKASPRSHAVIELIASPPRPVRLRYWLYLHEGYHVQARQMRQRLQTGSGGYLL